MNFLKVKNTNPVKSETVYHMTVKNNRNFFANSLCVHNCDYRGELMVIMENISDSDLFITHGDRIAQIVFAPIVQAAFTVKETLDETVRGSGGFGSTGK